METPTALARNLEVGLFGNKLRFQKSTSGSLREHIKHKEKKTKPDLWGHTNGSAHYI
jgi:hypothetical protein